MKLTTALSLLPLLIACGSSDTSTINPHGPCAGPIAEYEEANDVEPTDPGTQSDYFVGNGNFRAFYLGFSAGALNTATFNWGADFSGCQVSFE